MNDVTKRVLTPIIKELNFIFKNLNVNKIKAKKGRKIEWLEFTFEPEKRIHSKRYPNIENLGKSERVITREMTPEWLKSDRYQKSKTKSSEFTEEERRAFLKKMKKD